MSEAILQMLLSGRDDLSWFETNLTKFISKYNNKFIAFHNETIIDSDPNLDNLIKKLNKKSVDTSNIFIKFISKIKAIL